MHQNFRPRHVLNRIGSCAILTIIALFLLSFYTKDTTEISNEIVPDLPRTIFFLHIPKTAGTALWPLVSYHFWRENKRFYQIWGHPANPREINNLYNRSLIFGHFKHGIHNLFTPSLLEIRNALCYEKAINCTKHKELKTALLGYPPSLSPSASPPPSKTPNTDISPKKWFRIVNNRNTSHNRLAPTSPVPFSWTYTPTNFSSTLSTFTDFGYFAILRHPVDRIVSHYYYRRQRHEDKFHLICKENNITEAVRLLDDQNNAITQFVSGATKVPTQTEFELAKKNIQDMKFVGLYERLDESIVALHYFLKSEEYLVKLPKTKVSIRKPVSDLTSEQLQLLEPYYKYDMILYEIATKKFEEQILKIGTERFHKTVVQYKKILPSIFPRMDGDLGMGAKNPPPPRKHRGSVDSDPSTVGPAWGLPVSSKAREEMPHEEKLKIRIKQLETDLLACKLALSPQSTE